MNLALENLLTRRSIRKYKAAQITEAELNAVLEAGTYAPTAMGRQSPIIVAVQNSADLAVLSRLNAEIWGKVDIDPFYGAPTAIAVFADGGNKNGIQDASLVLGNLMNAAHAIGLGSCWINRAKETFETPEGKSLLEKWGIEGDRVGVGYCLLGYADSEAPVPKPRKSDYIVKVK
ncbi:MAG: nitroreductase family protein [Clostridia bacterium]|nr:nitroreductase family protein [Clostridia bacterium]